MTRMCDLPPELVGMIFTKIPITSLGAVRSTCKLWNALTKEWVLGKALAAAARHQFLGFMTMDLKVCSIRFHLRRSKDKEEEEEEEDLVDISIRQVDLLNQVEISKVFHCDGLLLCVLEDNSRLVVWNPYLGQARWIVPRTGFRRLDSYALDALGYDTNHNHKILRFYDQCEWVDDETPIFEFEIYDLSSNSWRLLDITPYWDLEYCQRCVSLKGNVYFFAQEKYGLEAYAIGMIEEMKDFLLCFDFTTERFGPRLPLPFHPYVDETVTLSCVREEQLSVLYQRLETNEMLEIWVTTKIEPNSVWWSKFLKVDMRPLTGFQFNSVYGSFFIDEVQKVAVVFDLDTDVHTKTSRYHSAFIIGDDGYFRSMSLKEAAPNLRKPRQSGYIPEIYSPPLVCSSSYFPSLVQINQRRKRKQRDWSKKKEG